jgi:NhaA family Na+:H+ antiporter
LAAGGVLVILMLLMRKAGVQSLLCYFVCGVLFWLAILYSGVHATISGVILGMMTPTEAYFTKESYAESAQPIFRGVREAIGQQDGDRAEVLLGEIEELTAGTEAPADRLVRLLHPWSSYLVLPIFALANSGVPLTIELIRQAAGSPITKGIVVGLLVGKFAGILLAAFLAVRLGAARLIPGVGWRQMAGIGALGGIGFTVSLFISDLAFAEEQAAVAKVSILGASAAAGALGYLMLRWAGNREA